MQEWIVSQDERGQRLDKYLRRRLPQAPSSFIYRMLRKKNITMHSHKASGSETVNTGDRVALFLSDETIGKFSGESQGTEVRNDTAEYEKAYRELRPLMGKDPVLYEDRHVVLVRKPAGVLSQKAQPGDVSVNEWLVGYLLQRKKDPVSADSLSFYTPSVCSRLDRNTGGILLCAASLQGSRELTALLRDRRMGKFYRAVVLGKTGPEGVIEGYLTKDGNNRSRMGTKASEGAKWSRTLYRTLQSGPHCSLVELKLETGRTHELRAHLSGFGHPIIGDPKYGDMEANRAAHRLARFQGQLLWCTRVEFPQAGEDGGAPELNGLYGKRFVCAPPDFYESLVRR